MADDVRVKYERKYDTQYLLSALHANYELVVQYWEGKLFCAMNLELDYKRRTVDLSIPGYVETLMHKYQNTTTSRT